MSQKDSMNNKKNFDEIVLIYRKEFDENPIERTTQTKIIVMIGGIEVWRVYIALISRQYCFCRFRLVLSIVVFIIVKCV